MIKPQKRDNQTELRKVYGIQGNSTFSLVLPSGMRTHQLGSGVETKLSKVKSQLVCPRCKKKREDLDCLYKVVLEVFSVKGASNPGVLLEDFEYTVCGTCQDEIERCIYKTREIKK